MLISFFCCFKVTLPVTLVHPHPNRATICLVIDEDDRWIIDSVEKDTTHSYCVKVEGVNVLVLCSVLDTSSLTPLSSSFFHLIRGIHGINQCEYLDIVASLNCGAKGLLYLNSAIWTKIWPLWDVICILLRFQEWMQRELYKTRMYLNIRKGSIQCFYASARYIFDSVDKLHQYHSDRFKWPIYIADSPEIYTLDGLGHCSKRYFYFFATSDIGGLVLCTFYEKNL